MAEYVEVLKQKERMCKSVDSCGECPLNRLSDIECKHYLLANPTEAEEIIMNWAKEHPVKTNADKFKEVFGVKHNNVMDILYQANFRKYCEFWNQEYKEPKGEW